MLLGALDALNAITGFGHNFKVGLLFQQQAYAGAQQGVIVDKQYACFHDGRFRQPGVRSAAGLG